MKELQNKNIFITGSSSGIGFGVAKKFFDSGSNVVINSKNLSKLKLASKKLNDCDYFQSDLTKKNSIISMFKKMKKEKKTIDVLICNYGNSNFDKNNLDFEHAFNANFFSAINTINYALPLLNKKSAKIICISSICGVEVIKNAPIGYSIAKSALNNYVKSISFVLGSKNIKINTIAPGNIYFKGSVWEKKIKKNKSLIKKYIKNNVSLNKFGSIGDIFNMCKFLSSDSNQFLNGSTIILDGGQTSKY
jgi:3-oxoacyl-[acyl-carrier protein] reductase